MSDSARESFESEPYEMTVGGSTTDQSNEYKDNKGVRFDEAEPAVRTFEVKKIKRRLQDEGWSDEEDEDNNENKQRGDESENDDILEMRKPRRIQGLHEPGNISRKSSGATIVETPSHSRRTSIQPMIAEHETLDNYRHKYHHNQQNHSSESLDEKERARSSTPDHRPIDEEDARINAQAARIVKRQTMKQEAAKRPAHTRRTSSFTKIFDMKSWGRKSTDSLHEIPDLELGGKESEDITNKPIMTGVLGSLMMLGQRDNHSAHSSTATLVPKNNKNEWQSDEEDGRHTQKKHKSWHNKFTSPKQSPLSSPRHSPKNSSSALASLVNQSSRGFFGPAMNSQNTKHFLDSGMSTPRKEPATGGKDIAAQLKQALIKSTKDEELRIIAHVADVLHRQEFIVKLCKALMRNGAPTHRLEENLRVMSRVLCIEAQFLYFPGVMIISFGDPDTRTSEMQIVRVDQGIHLSDLQDVHTVYKDVIHDQIDAREAACRLKEINERKAKYPLWAQIFVYGLASALVGPFAFGGRAIDMPVAFLFGMVLAIIQLVLPSKNPLLKNVSEILSSVIIAFLARAFGSIRPLGTICFASLAESGIVLILPGYIVLMAALELQSKNIIAGAIRMLYAILYSLFLGFGISFGTALYGWMDHGANASAVCEGSVDPIWRILIIPAFTLCLCFINEAKWKQMPLMVVIASAGYSVSYTFSTYVTTSSTSSAQASLVSAASAFLIGLLGNFYSKIPKKSIFKFFGYTTTMSAILPAVLVQVPSGLAAQGGLLGGIADATNQTTSAAETFENSPLTFGIRMVEVSIGISFGLFASAIVAYPLGKKNRALFSF